MEEAVATQAPKAPVTGERKIRDDLEENLPKPCMRDIGFNPFSSFFIAILINLTLSHRTLPYARTEPDKLSFEELWRMTEANRLAFDFAGWVISKGEWLLLYRLAKDQNGFLHKEAVRRCFDGSLFEYCAKMNKGGDRKRRAAD
ncbi:hypothetical protein QUC31_016429 [Theobroma cacao]